MTDAALLRLPRQVIALVDTQTDADERDGDGEENLDIPHRFSHWSNNRAARGVVADGTHLEGTWEIREAVVLFKGS